MTSSMDTLRRNLRYAMCARGLTADRLAVLCGMEGRLLRRIVSDRGRKALRPERISAIARALKVPPGDLVFDEPDRFARRIRVGDLRQERAG